MNPAANAATSGGTAGAVVVIANWVLSLFNCAPMPADVQTAVAVLLTAAVGYFIHTQTRA